MASIFTQLIQKEIPAHILYEDDTYFSFLDIRPISTGHALLIPKQEIDYMFDLDDDLLAGLMPIAKKIAIALKTVTQCHRVGMMVAGMEVPHAHLHLVPIANETQLSFAHAKPADPDELARLCTAIRAEL